jgi:hypothetical protein
MRVNAITMRDQFSGRSEFWWGDQGVVWVFLCKRLPELFTHTIVWVYWKPYLLLLGLRRAQLELPFDIREASVNRFCFLERSQEAALLRPLS